MKELFNRLRDFIKDAIGCADLHQYDRRHREWRRQQISLEIEEANTEVAQLAAYIGQLQKEKAALEQELNRAHD
jgi:hypothetical protein